MVDGQVTVESTTRSVRETFVVHVSGAEPLKPPWGAQLIIPTMLKIVRVDGVTPKTVEVSGPPMKKDGTASAAMPRSFPLYESAEWPAWVESTVRDTLRFADEVAARKLDVEVLAEALHTGWRKGTDDEAAMKIHRLIQHMPPKQWKAYVEWVRQAVA